MYVCTDNILGGCIIYIVIYNSHLFVVTWSDVRTVQFVCNSQFIALLQINQLLNIHMVNQVDW